MNVLERLTRNGAPPRQVTGDALATALGPGAALGVATGVGHDPASGAIMGVVGCLAGFLVRIGMQLLHPSGPRRARKEPSPICVEREGR